MLCPTCAKVNESSAPACSLCGTPFGAAASGQRRRAPALDQNDRRRTTLGVGAGPEAPAPLANAPPAEPPPGLARKVPTLQGVRAPALEARNKVRTVIGVAMPGPGNDRPAPAPAPPPGPRDERPASAAPAPALPRALTPDALPASPRQVLCELLRRHGEEIMTDPRRCGSLLAADYHRQVSYLVAALEERIPQRLVVESTTAPVEAVVRAMADELGRRRELPATSALYAVESWAIALGLIAPRAGSSAAGA